MTYDGSWSSVWTSWEYMLVIDINQSKDLMNFERDFDKSSEIKIFHCVWIIEWKLRILKKYKDYELNYVDELTIFLANPVRRALSVSKSSSYSKLK